MKNMTLIFSIKFIYSNFPSTTVHHQKKPTQLPKETSKPFQVPGTRSTIIYGFQMFQDLFTCIRCITEPIRSFRLGLPLGPRPAMCRHGARRGDGATGLRHLVLGFSHGYLNQKAELDEIRGRFCCFFLRIWRNCGIISVSIHSVYIMCIYIYMCVIHTVS